MDCRRRSGPRQQFVRPERHPGGAAAGVMRRDSPPSNLLCPPRGIEVTELLHRDSDLRSSPLRGGNPLCGFRPILPSLRFGRMVRPERHPGGAAAGVMRRDSPPSNLLCPPTGDRSH